MFIDSLKYSPRFISDPPTYEDRKKNTTKKKTETKNKQTKTTTNDKMIIKNRKKGEKRV